VRRSWALIGALALLSTTLFPVPDRARFIAAAEAQGTGEGWSAGINAPKMDGAQGEAAAGGAATPGAEGNTTIVPRREAPGTGDGSGTIAQIRLVALLTADGQRIDQGIIWRVYRDDGSAGGGAKLIGTHRDASPLLKLAPGAYVINAAFGRAHLTRVVHLEAGGATPAIERFVLNAGGLRVGATVSGAPAHNVAYSIYSDRDQTDDRKLIMSAIKPGLIVRLNAGIYHIVSTYGDANAVIESDVTVEAGKLTEATVAHAAGKVTLKLVARAGGEAIADTQWSIQTPEGRIIKESIGALPTHILAPGSYVAVAKSNDRAFRRDFSVKDGETTQIEVINQ
jgi:preprotein translocase subunit YajC